MIDYFFQIGPIPPNSMHGTYDVRLVILSYIVATFASYIALDITARLRDINITRYSILLWLFGGAFAMGAGIWSMHFIGMLAFTLPMPMIYNSSWTILSMLVAIGASWFALFMLKAKIIKPINLALGGIILGLAIAAMHYTGMQAMTSDMSIHYQIGKFILSIIIAIAASEAAIYLALKSTQIISRIQTRLKFFSACIMGAGICGMHYVGMIAAVFTPNGAMATMTMKDSINPELLSISIATVTLIILGIAFIASSYKESLNQHLLLTARQAGMAEVAASVLHNVGNVLNSVNVSSMMISEKIQDSKLSGLTDLKKMLSEHKDDFINFVQNDTRGKHIVDYICSLSDYWENEKQFLSEEVTTLVKNIDHIKAIIATQQDISKVNEAQQLISIQDLINEAILISGIDHSKYNIKIQIKYERKITILADKAKLLQIIINLIQNAKDSLIEETKSEKILIIKTILNGKYISIYIIDNGLGINKNNLIKIFSYGFTTKKTGHGFGLHTSAITAAEMGGKLIAKSEGLGSGATFILKLPLKSY